MKQIITRVAIFGSLYNLQRYWYKLNLHPDKRLRLKQTEIFGAPYKAIWEYQ